MTKESVKNFAVKAKDKFMTFKYGVMMGMINGACLATGGVNAGGMTGGTTVTIDEGADAATAMGAVIGVVLTIMRYVGVAMLVYGVYEIVMSIQNNQPEAKTKGIIMALSGVVMIAIKSLLTAFGVTVS